MRNGPPALLALLIFQVSPAAAVEWDVSLWGERRVFTEHVHKLAELVEQKTDGEFTLNIDYGGLSKSTENLDGIAFGAFEMAQFCAGYHDDKNPTITVLELPFLGVSSLEEEVAVSRAIYEHPAVAEDLGRWNARLLMPSPTLQQNIAGTGEPRRTVDGFRGMRVRATGGMAEMLEAVGAVPAQIVATESYDALESGIVDAVAFAPHAHLSYGIVDIADWWTTNFDGGAMACPVAVNIDAYEDLSPEHRAALDGSVDEALEHYIAGYERLLEEWEATLDAQGVTRVTFSASEHEKLREVASSIHQRWIERMTTQGYPAQELYDLVQSTLRAVSEED